MRGLRSTLVLLLVLVGLGGYIYFVTSKKSPDDEVKKDRIFPSLEASAIAELKVRALTGDATTLKKDGDAWKIVAPAEFTAAETEATGIANALADMTFASVVDENPADLKPYGLDPPKMEIEFKSADGTTAGHLLIGDKTATGGNLYVRKANEKRLLLIPQYHETTLNKSTFDLRDKTIVKFDRSKVDGSDAEVDGRPMEFVKANGDWRMTRPLAARADYSAIEGLIGHVEAAQMKSVAGTASTPEDLRKFGLDAPQATVNLHLGSARASFVIGGRADDTSVYVRDASRPDVFTLDATVASDLRKPAEDYRSRNMFDFRAFTATHVEITRGGQTVVFERVKAKDDKSVDTWHRVSPNPGDPDRLKVENMLSGIADIRATSFVNSRTRTGLDTPAMTVVSKFDEGKREERVTFGKVGLDVFAARTDDPGPAQVEAAKFDEAVKALDELSK